jgi:glycosyltransferase involved in cell wall biosynthesis
MTTTSDFGIAPSSIPLPGVLPAAATDEPSPVSAPQPHEGLVDEQCIERVESLLDATEMAIGLADQEYRGEASPLDFRLSVAIPVYNERETIREIVERVQAVPLEKELVIVDDCSTDGTRHILAELAQEPNIRVFYHEYNHGKGAALRTAFLHAEGDFVIVQDADLEYDPADYPKLLLPLIEGQADVVYGSRFLGDEVRDPSFVHRLGNRMLTAASNVFTRQKLTDMETCYKAFRREVLADIDIQQDRFGFEPEITAKLSRRGCQILEVPINYHGRSYDEGKKIGLADAFNALFCIVRYAWKD